MAEQDLIPLVKHTVAISSGKGGVGKTTVAVNLAVALAQSGLQVGLLDCDVYGPNVPLMMGVKQPDMGAGGQGQKLIPPQNYGVKLMSIGFFVSDDNPVVWRGPMINSAIQQFLRDVDWGALDYLIVDLPPGTGDAQLSLSQLVPLTGAVIVTTPQEVSLLDSRKGLAMFQKVNVPVLGIIENMSSFVCPHCKERTDIFSHGGGRKAAEALGVPFLGEIPIDPAIRTGGDSGRPLIDEAPTSPQAETIRQIAKAITEQVTIVTAAATKLTIIQ